MFTSDQEEIRDWLKLKCHYYISMIGLINWYMLFKTREINYLNISTYQFSEFVDSVDESWKKIDECVDTGDTLSMLSNAKTVFCFEKNDLADTGVELFGLCVPLVLNTRPKRNFKDFLLRFDVPSFFSFFNDWYELLLILLNYY